MVLVEDNNQKNYKYVDALRGIAILMVMAVHVSQSNSLDISDLTKSVLKYGSKGVQLFFMVSAFTLFMSLNARYEKEKRPFLNYAIRRFFRIAPMYYIALIFYTTVLVIYSPTRDGIVLNALFLHGWSIKWFNNIVPGGWSIGVEMMFYIVLPFVFLKIKNIDHAIKFLILSMVFKAILDYVLRIYLIVPNKEEFDLFLTFYLPSQMPTFALGIAMYFIIEKKEYDLTNIKQSSLILLVGVVLFTLLLESSYLIDNFVCFGCMFLILSIFMSRAKGLLLNWPLLQIGKFSFSLYLSHFAVIHVLEKLDLYYIKIGGIFDFVYRYTLVLLFAFLVSAITYHLIESKFQVLGKILIKKLSKD